MELNCARLGYYFFPGKRIILGSSRSALRAADFVPCFSFCPPFHEPISKVAVRELTSRRPARGSYPRVVIPHAEAGKGLTIVMHQRLGEFEDQRVSGIKGYIHLTAEDEILLCVVLRDTIDDGGAAKGIARIKRSPDAVVKRMADVSFNSG